MAPVTQWLESYLYYLLKLEKPLEQIVETGQDGSRTFIRTLNQSLEFSYVSNSEVFPSRKGCALSSKRKA